MSSLSLSDDRSPAPPTIVDEGVEPSTSSTRPQKEMAPESPSGLSRRPLPSDGKTFAPSPCLARSPRRTSTRGIRNVAAGAAGRVERSDGSRRSAASTPGASPCRRRSRGRASTAGTSRASSTARPRRFTARARSSSTSTAAPKAQYQPGFLGRNNFYLNELGVAMIYPNVRGSSGYGKRTSRSTTPRSAKTRVKDIGALLDWIAAQPDPRPAAWS